MNDWDLLNELQQDDIKAFSAIYDKYWEDLFNHAFKRLKDADVVSGILQDLFADLWEKRNTIKIHTSLKAFLYTSLRFKIFSYIRAKIVREEHIKSSNFSTNIYSNPVEETTFLNDLQISLEKSINLLPDQPRRVYKLKYEDGLSYKEISLKLGISTSTAEKHLIKALKLIRSYLKEYTLMISCFADFIN